MPNYRYEHESGTTTASGGCELGEKFWQEQTFAAEPLTRCPCCGGKVFRAILPVGVNSPQSDTDLRTKGFTKLVRRDSGVYENVTALDGESRYVRAGQPETLPDFDRRKLDG